MQPIQCVLQHHVANPHVSTHMATPDNNNHVDIPLRSAPADSKTPCNYARTTTPKATLVPPLQCGKKKAKRPQPHPPHTGGTFHRRLQPLYTEKHKVLCSGFLPKTKPTKPMQHSCSHYNAFCSITSQTCTYLRTWQHQMTAIMQPFQCDLQPQIPKHPVTTHAQAHPKLLCATVTVRQKKANRPQPHPPHTGGTFHRRLRPLYMEKRMVLCSGFLPKTKLTKPMQHSCSHYNAFCSITWLTRM